MKKRVFLRFPNFLSKAVTLSYDDGPEYDKRLIEIMLKNKLKGTFNLNSGVLYKDHSGKNIDYNIKKAITLYKDSGMEVAVHGYKHYSLVSMGIASATNEVLTDRKTLEQIFGQIVNGMAYAYGYYSKEILEVLKVCGINYARTGETTGKFSLPENWLEMRTTCHHNNPKLMQLAREFIEDKKTNYYWIDDPKLFFLWGHSYEFNSDNNWNVIEDFASYIGNREDVWYATNSEIYEYVTAYDNLVFSVDSKLVYNPSGTTVYIDYFDNQFKIPPLATVKIG